jgi:organic radical activating enzyme
MLIPVHETFQSTIQGEGYHAGTVVDFIRLSGCPVGCYFCDTGYADGGPNAPRTMRSIDDLIDELQSPTVVISGGEPMIHSGLIDLCGAIGETGRRVHIETSGAIYRDVPDFVWLTLSPKDHVAPRSSTKQQAWDRANEIKIVVCDGTEVAFYRSQLNERTIPCYLQPEYENQSATSITMDMLRRDPWMRLSLQTHKLIGVP